jgi:hypothetical protein
MIIESLVGLLGIAYFIHGLLVSSLVFYKQSKQYITAGRMIIWSKWRKRDSSTRQFILPSEFGLLKKMCISNSLIIIIFVYFNAS